MINLVMPTRVGMAVELSIRWVGDWASETRTFHAVSG